MLQLSLEKLPVRCKHYFACSSNVHSYFTQNAFNNNMYSPRYSTNKTQNCLEYCILNLKYEKK